MRILLVAPYIYKKEWLEFTRNATGFGIMVCDIYETMKSIESETFLLTQVITGGHDKVLKHTWADVLKGAKLKDLGRGFKYFFRFGQGLKNRFRHFYYGLNAGTLRYQINRLKPDVVHIHGLGVQTKPYIDICEETGVPYIITLHGLVGLDESTNSPKWDKDFEREFLIDAEKKNIPITVISTGMKKRIEENYLHHNAKNISVVCNGTNIDSEDNSNNQEKSKDKVDLRKEYSLTPTDKIIVVIGSVCDRKNQIQIVRAFMTGVVNVPCHVFICGKDCTNGEVQKQIEENCLSDRIHMLGFVSHERVIAILEQADLNVVASKDEGFGLSCIEAYVYGVPTVIFEDLDAVEDLYDRRAMIKIGTRDDSSLGTAIEKSLRMTWDRDWIRDYSKAFSLEAMASKYGEIYRQTLCERGCNKY